MRKLQETLIGGFVATIALIVAIYFENMSGLLSLNPPLFIDSLSGEPIWIGWLVHLVICWIFAFFYVYYFIRVFGWIKRLWLRGTVYGVMVAILIVIAMYMWGDYIPAESMTSDIYGMLIAYTIYGLVLGILVPAEKEKSDEPDME